MNILDFDSHIILPLQFEELLHLNLQIHISNPFCFLLYVQLKFGTYSFIFPPFLLYFFVAIKYNSLFKIKNMVKILDDFANEFGGRVDLRSYEIIKSVDFTEYFEILLCDLWGIF